MTDASNLDRVLALTDVKVEKAALPMKAGESVQDFMSALKDALEKKLETPAKLKENGFIALTDVYGDNAIVTVYPGYKANETPPSPVFVKMEYARDVKGEFEFGDMVEMERKVVFIPKGQTTVITKNAFWGNLL